MTPIHFTRNRLHVGYLAQDWSDVWYEPDKEKNEDDESEIMLFHLVTGEPQPREPMEGEVKWHPHYNPKNCEAEGKAQQKRLQQRFLTDAHQYLSLNDPDAIRELEAKWDEERVNFPRFKSWFKAAKKFKKTQMKKKSCRRRKRTDEARANGVSQEVIEQDVTSETSDSDSDSAYGSVQGDRLRANTPNSDMAPPPLPKKRESISNGKDGREIPLKKMKLTKSSRIGNGLRGPTPRMSGALSNRPDSRSRSVGTNRSRGRSIGRGTDCYEGGDEEDMDTRNPFDQASMSPHLRGGTWGFDGIGRDSGYHDRTGSIGIAGLNGPTNGASLPHGVRDDYSRRFQATVETDDESVLERHVREQSALFLDENEAFEAAIRMSQEPQTAGSGDGVVDSIENGDENSPDGS